MSGTDGQHVGAQRPDVVFDEAGSMPLDEFRAKAAALAALRKPRNLERGHDTGNGDRCPLVPSHGRMYVLDQVQYCAHIAHDGWHEVPRTRALWPFHDFEAAVEADRKSSAPQAELPDIDITALMEA